MAITQDQAEQIKKQLISQIEKSFPPENKEFAKSKIQAMSPEELEIFLKNNNLVAGGESPEGEESQCIFCNIVLEKIPSYKLSENENAIAVLEIRPLSKGHTLIIPKSHPGEINAKIKELKKQISKKLKTELKPKEIKTENSEIFGHNIINLIPIYEGEKLRDNSEREPAKEEDLFKLQEKLKIKPKPKTIKQDSKPKRIGNVRIPKRIP